MDAEREPWFADSEAIAALREYVEHLTSYAESYGPEHKLTERQSAARSVYDEVGRILADLAPAAIAEAANSQARPE
jgi:hypothetical protein